MRSRQGLSAPWLSKALCQLPSERTPRGYTIAYTCAVDFGEINSLTNPPSAR